MNEFDHPLPNNAEAERAILGAILLDNRLIKAARAQLLPDQFYVPSHRRIFLAMCALADEKVEINPILIGEQLKLDNSFEIVGGVSFITNLTYGLPHSGNIAHYTKIVSGKAALRELIKLATKITTDALKEEDEPDLIVENAEKSLLALAMQSRIESKSTPRTYDQIGGSVVDLFEAWRQGKAIAIPTQIPEIDRKLAYGGFNAQDFIVIAARTSFGKSALALQIALNTARSGIPVLIFSLEMGAEKLFIRNLSSITSIPHWQISPQTFANDQETSTTIISGIGKLAALPIQVEDRTFSLYQLCSIARDWKRRHGTEPGLLITDYIQLVSNKLEKRSREQEVAGVSLELKRLATELNIPVIGVSQFSREQAKQNRRPELSDLRESGQIEQDVDVVLFPWSDEPITDHPVRALKLYCAKQRSGRAGWEIDIDFDAEHQWFFTKEMYRNGNVA